MKRIFALFFVMLFIIALNCFVFAEDVPTNETITDTQTSVVGENSPEEIITTDKIKEVITNSTLWVTLGTVLTTVIGCLAVFKRNFTNVATLVSSKADAKTIVNELQKATDNINSSFISELEKIQNKLKDTEDNEKALSTILSIFIMNSNINPNAKAEIMQYISGIKNMADKSIQDVVITATAAIEKANAAEIKKETPALDKITKTSTETKMILG